MRSSDVQAVGELAGEALAAGGRLISEMHEGIASRVFANVGAGPARTIHDGISSAVYTGVREGLRGAARGGGKLAARRAPSDGPGLDSHPVASFVLGAINGFYGNHIAQRGNALASRLEVRRHGEPVDVSAGGLGAAFPDATSRVVVFVHGLCGTEATWWWLARGSDRSDRRSYGERLQDELSFTPVYLRYNTGLHISENGCAIAWLLEELARAWPVGVEELVLVGHSMGGLVARSACHYAEREDLRWTAHVRHVFCLGTPHLGADLERGANAAAWAAARLPETRALASFLNARSVGIKDLRYGSCVEDDWCDCDPDEFLRDRCQEVPFLADANYYFIGATLREGPVGSLIGDLLVRMPSASGRGSGKGRRIPFEVDNGHELTGPNHIDLLCHPAVYRQLRSWIERPVPEVVATVATA